MCVEIIKQWKNLTL